MLPNFLIIGAARCGTSYLASNFRSHPEIFVPTEKELHFFERDYDKGMDFYESYFPDNADTKFKAVGEATPAYLYFPDMPERIHEHLPDAKLIASLRNPVDTAYSLYWKAYSNDERTRAITFEEKLETEPRMIRGGRYHEQLSRYTKYFPRENLYIVIYEEMIRRPEEELRKLFRFLGVDESFMPPLLHNKVNSSGMLNTNNSFPYYVHRLLFWYLNLPLPRLGQWIENKILVKLPEMKESTRQALWKEFEPDVEKLEEFLGRDLSIWRARNAGGGAP
jgi:hypothetical protein